MTKKVIALLAVVLTAGFAYGQGAVNFNTQNAGAKVTLDPSEGGAALAGQAYLAQLYAAAGAGAAESSLLAVGAPVYFRGGNNAGYVVISGTASGPSGNVPSVVNVFTAAQGGANGPATIQMRAWETARGASWEAAGGAGAPHVGESAILNLTATGGYGVPPATPVELTGLQGFSLRPVPEPSTIALGLLGAAALLIRRRK